jgi:predicted AAA+ superfamily ATPase
MALTRESYRSRIIDSRIRTLLGTFGAISVEGPRWCGKTWTTLNHANSAVFLMDRDTKTLAELNPANILSGEKPHAIDEWQEVPAIWDAVRHGVDMNPGPGQYILTGSVTKPFDKISHSGAGRIARIRMRTMSLFETGDSVGAVSLEALFEKADFAPMKVDMPVRRIIDIACRGGWPASLHEDIAEPLELPRSYMQNLVDNNLSESGRRPRDAEKLSLLLASLGRNNATIVKNATLHNDIQSAAGEISGKTLSSYLQLLRDLFLLEELPGWRPDIRSKARILSVPKRFFCDPSLAVVALGATPEKLFSKMQVFGLVFEGLCLRDLLIYSDAMGAEVFHYRDNSHLGVDAVIETRDGRWAGFEIKLGETEVNKGAAALRRLRDKIVGSGGEAPAFLAVLTAGGVAMRREDGVLAIPISALKN